MSATETALLGLLAALDKLAAAGAPALPAVLRNEDLSARVLEMSNNVGAYANLWDGKQTEREEYLGADSLANAYEITHEARLELAFTGGEAIDRNAMYDAALVAINDKLLADRTLGGTVDFADFGDLEFQGSGLITDGVPHAKGVVVPVILTFRSSRPF